MAADIKKLLEGVEGLSEELALKVETLFQAAVLETSEQKVTEEIKKIEEAFDAKLAEVKEEFTAEYSTKLDGKVEEAIAQWAESNKEVLDKKAKADIAESFIIGLKGLFTENAVILPEATGTEMVEALQAEKAEIIGKLHEAEAALAEKAKLVESFTKEKIVAELTESLADTQKDRIARLAKEFSLTTESEYRQKVAFIIEGFVVDTKKEDETDEADKKKKGEVEEAAAKVVDESTSATAEKEPVFSSLVEQVLAFERNGKL